MKQNNGHVKSILGLPFLVLLCSGCATFGKDAARDTERTLAAAGFRMKTATTPDQRTHL